MANTSPNAVYPTTAPVASGQVISGNSEGLDSRELRGTAETTGDGSSASFTVGFIDGTKTLSWTPSGILVTRIPASASDDTATFVPTQVTALSNAAFTVRMSSTITNGNKIKIAFQVW